MGRAHLRGAARSGRFYFRKNVFTRGTDLRSSTPPSQDEASEGRSLHPDCAPCVEAIAAKLREQQSAREESPTPRTREPSRASSAASLASLGSSAPLPGPGTAALEEAKSGPRKEARLKNCFPAIPPPSEEEKSEQERVPVDEEYEEMSMEDIICGKVGWTLSCPVSLLTLVAGRFPWLAWTGKRIRRLLRRRREGQGATFEVPRPDTTSREWSVSSVLFFLLSVDDAQAL